MKKDWEGYVGNNYMFEPGYDEDEEFFKDADSVMDRAFSFLHTFIMESVSDFEDFYLPLYKDFYLPLYKQYSPASRRKSVEYVKSDDDERMTLDDVFECDRLLYSEVMYIKSNIILENARKYGLWYCFNHEYSYQEKRAYLLNEELIGLFEKYKIYFDRIESVERTQSGFKQFNILKSITGSGTKQFETIEPIPKPIENNITDITEDKNHIIFCCGDDCAYYAKCEYLTSDYVKQHYKAWTGCNYMVDISDCVQELFGDLTAALDFLFGYINQFLHYSIPDLVNNILPDYRKQLTGIDDADDTDNEDGDKNNLNSVLFNDKVLTTDIKYITPILISHAGKFNIWLSSSKQYVKWETEKKQGHENHYKTILFVLNPTLNEEF